MAAADSADTDCADVDEPLAGDRVGSLLQCALETFARIIPVMVAVSPAGDEVGGCRWAAEVEAGQCIRDSGNSLTCCTLSTNIVHICICKGLLQVALVVLANVWCHCSKFYLPDGYWADMLRHYSKNAP
jgi:hypothetical protein